MFPFVVFSKMKLAIKKKVIHHENGLYLYVVFPIATTFLLTYIGARILSHFAPQVYFAWFGIHVHHFAYGFFVMACAGYLSLVHSGPRGKYYISLLYGFGLGLTFDEFGMWINLDDQDPSRWSYNGFLIIIGIILVILSARPGIKFVKNHLPFSKKNQFL
jgi:hypothetical protein